MSLPLSGITVIALEQAIAVPLATRHLAELGARVIKVERPGTGDFARSYDQRARGLSSHFVWTNRGKESIELDLTAAADATLLRRMIARADVVVQNLGPGAAARLGFGPEAARKLNERLVYCSVSGYGEGGPYAGRKAYDLLIQAEAGVLDVTGTEADPAKAGIPVADIAGAMYAYCGILAALLQRGQAGPGSVLEVNLLEALTEWMGYPLAYALEDGRGPARTGARHAAIYPYGPFATGSGETVYLAVQNEREWESFCRYVLEQPELAAGPRFAGGSQRLRNREELDIVIRTAFSRLSAGEVIGRLDEAKIGYARMRGVGEVRTHPHLRARGRWREVGSPVGPLPVLLPPVTSDAFEPAVGDVPSLGNANEALRKEFGG
jgi:itaconate CoA-transferase